MVYVLLATRLPSDDRVIMASEAGALAIDQSTIIEKGQFNTGKNVCCGYAARPNY
jgi:hypothetical protein